ncbi:MAG: glycosyltransferase, partial [Gammaproteobacteria bacterium]|nr:glycosyltransferase [Gammaproteobacteria bacterium]
LIEDEEAFFFNNEIDIVSIVKYFLSHEEQREHAASAAHKKALSIFGYDRVAKTIIETIRQRYT